MQTHSVSVTISGTRGSIPVSGKLFSHYGGATCCVLIRTIDGIVVLDAGTGLLPLSPLLRDERQIPIFISHCHADHILGLPMFQSALTPGYQLDIYGAIHEGKDIRSQITALVSPPLWPVCPEQLPAEIRFHDIPSRVELNGIVVETAEGCHPGGVTIYRVTAGERKLVYMTDCTINDDNRAFLLDFCRDCDLLLCDGQYSDEQWLTCSAFGHNRWNDAARFGNECGAKMVRVLHHAPTHTDSILDQARLQVQSISPVCDLAFDGEEITL